MPKVNFDVTNPLVKRVGELKTNVVFSLNDGNYKEYKQSLTELAKIGADNFELVKSVPSINIRRSAFVFSKGFFSNFVKPFFNAQKVLFLNAFRVKTPEEKKYMQLVKEDRQKEEYKQKVRARIHSDLRYEIDKKINPEIDRMVNEKTDQLMEYISSTLLEQLSERSLTTEPMYMESLINSAIKDIPKFLRSNEKEGLYKSIYNKEFLKRTSK